MGSTLLRQGTFSKKLVNLLLTYFIPLLYSRLVAGGTHLAGTALLPSWAAVRTAPYRCDASATYLGRGVYMGDILAPRIPNQADANPKGSGWRGHCAPNCDT